ncbi:MAG: PduL/EutD family phosphate acyltransferase [Candidatus Uhrbacteria bacterium]|nr:PduL/EutD family phosphate acyltransferase [Candidatus Uhrbacteria bacterium]
MDIPVVVQHRHVHLSEEDACFLFGDDALELIRVIDQRDQFVCKQQVSVHGPNGSFPQVSVIGPVRARTQVELSASDAFAIGVDAPLRLSGDLDRSATVILKTDHGEIQAKMSTIIPIRHLHLPSSVAESMKLMHHDVVSVTLKGSEGIVFDQVVVRVHPTFKPAFHLTKDEAAPSWIQTGDFVTV